VYAHDTHIKFSVACEDEVMARSLYTAAFSGHQLRGWEGEEREREGER